MRWLKQLLCSHNHRQGLAEVTYDDETGVEVSRVVIEYKCMNCSKDLLK